MIPSLVVSVKLTDNNKHRICLDLGLDSKTKTKQDSKCGDISSLSIICRKVWKLRMKPNVKQ